ncbi:MAG TPA: ABC transporter ATP-binding protein [Kofleriaceae bacterium]|nr:ABC transporter ATP-binding protein [Kofleriaceae bacterium]
MIRLDGVGFSYGERPVLAQVSCEIGAGELVAIIGPNGAGKTTLLELVAGLRAPSRGTVQCAGVDPHAAPRFELARRLSFLPQHYDVVFPFTVAEIVLMGRYPHRRRGLLALERDDDLLAAEAAMQRCDVLPLADRRFDAISGGERRLALLAQAFCQRSEIILLDEPTAALDPAHAIAVFQALRAEAAERAATAVVVTHDLNLAARFADRVLVIAGGGLAATGAPAEVLASPAAEQAFGVPMLVGELPDGAGPFVVPR